MPTASASWTKTEPSSSRTTSLRLLFDYLVESRGWKNGVGKSVATTNLINALAKHHKMELHETPVGFKYIGELIKAGQDRNWRGRKRWAVDPPPRSGEGRSACRAAVLRDGGTPGQDAGPNNSRSYLSKLVPSIPQRENFRLTAEVKEKFTGKLQSRSARILRPQGRGSGAQGWVEAGSRRWIVGLLPAFRNGAGGASVFGGSRRKRSWRN